jgi:uncharacterized protein (TIGR04255 family)
MPPPPKKLKRDAIVEALLEIQFDHNDAAEVVIGRLSADPAWASYSSQRLPLADMPSIVRDADPSLRFQAIAQLLRPTPGEVVKIGSRVLSIHVLAPYPGWDTFRVRIADTISALCRIIPSARIHQVALRYINAITPDHGVGQLWDLDVAFLVAGKRPEGDFMAAYQETPTENVKVQVTIATPAFVVGNPVSHACAFVDVAVSTKVGLGPIDATMLTNWVEKAHELEKEAFFALWPETLLEPLREN